MKLKILFLKRNNSFLVISNHIKIPAPKWYIVSSLQIIVCNKIACLILLSFINWVNYISNFDHPQHIQFDSWVVVIINCHCMCFMCDSRFLVNLVCWLYAFSFRWLKEHQSDLGGIDGSYKFFIFINLNVGTAISTWIDLYIYIYILYF